MTSTMYHTIWEALASPFSQDPWSYIRERGQIYVSLDISISLIKYIRILLLCITLIWNKNPENQVELMLFPTLFSYFCFLTTLNLGTEIIAPIFRGISANIRYTLPLAVSQWARMWNVERTSTAGTTQEAEAVGNVIFHSPEWRKKNCEWKSHQKHKPYVN